LFLKAQNIVEIAPNRVDGTMHLLRNTPDGFAAPNSCFRDGGDLLVDDFSLRYAHFRLDM
jgi:hypothetical protein